MTDANQADLTPQSNIVPLATVRGQAIMDLPKDLYIPPDAMQVFLEAFEGPLDFLLYLIRKQNLDILDIPVAQVTQQYMEYINLMQNLTLELAGEYLVMAAILAEIKSRMLLPKIAESDNAEDDPRAELVRRLQEYERFKQAAENLEKLPRQERDFFVSEIDDSTIAIAKPAPQVKLAELVYALVDVMKRLELSSHHHIQMEALSIRDKMTHILSALQDHENVLFSDFFNLREGRLGIVVNFLAILELLKQSLVDYVQAAPFSPIYLKAKGNMAALRFTEWE